MANSGAGAPPPVATRGEGAGDATAGDGCATAEADGCEAVAVGGSEVTTGAELHAASDRNARAVTVRRSRRIHMAGPPRRTLAPSASLQAGRTACATPQVVEWPQVGPGP